MIQDPITAAWVHMLFEYAGIAVGVQLYRMQRRKHGQTPMLATGAFAIVVGLLIGAGLGNKLASLLQNPLVLQAWWNGQWAMPGQSIVGGLIGGLIGVEIAKWLTKQTASTGDAMVMPLVAGIVVGRIGCFFAGLHDDTYGIQTALRLGIDFGDSIKRHPTQLYDMIFVSALALVLYSLRERLAGVAGLQFKLFLSAYLLWRLVVDTIKPMPWIYPGGLSGLQWLCAVTLLLYTPWLIRDVLRLKKGQ
jgi:phosphatidylglycerol---prolipoprotein diacylglyceryl transferase